MILEHRKSKDKALYGESFTNKAFADLLMPDSKSPYAIEGESTSEWNVYNALTQQLSDSKDILYVPSKSFEAYEMIKNLTNQLEERRDMSIKDNILIIGQSGVGKSTSLRNLDGGKTIILNTERKRLPFPDKTFTLTIPNK